MISIEDLILVPVILGKLGFNVRYETRINKIETTQLEMAK